MSNSAIDILRGRYIETEVEVDIIDILENLDSEDWIELREELDVYHNIVIEKISEDEHEYDKLYLEWFEEFKKCHTLEEARKIGG